MKTNNELNNTGIVVRGYTKEEQAMIDAYLANNEVTECPDAEPKKEYKAKALSSSIITTVSSTNNIFWNEMARQRDVEQAKRVIENEITVDEFMRNLKGE